MIENERKYILEDHGWLAYMRKLKQYPGTLGYHITQGYVAENARIRRTIDLRTSEEKHEFTFKMPTSGGLVEIEKEITDNDFKLLWENVKKVITKTRIKIPHGNLIWEVDFFTIDTMDSPFLVMAEVELPVGVEEPDEVPDFISDYLIHLVERSDKRFINAKMAAPLTVKKAVEKLKEDKKARDGNV